MTTLLKETSIKSISLMTGLECEAKLFPSKEKGIRFYLGGQCVEAAGDNVVSTDHCVVLGNDKIKIMLVEHFLAACAVMGINALDVYLSHFELPILDGSSKLWVELFKDAGVEKKEEKKYTIKEPVFYQNGKTHLAVLPSNEFRATYSVNFDHPDLSNRWVSLTDDDLDEIIRARTFGYLKDLKALQTAGFAKGVSIENTVGITEEGYTTELNSRLEPIKHKILDLIGDFYLTGINPLDMNVEIIAKEAGHAVHVKVAQILKDKLIEEK